MGRGLHPQDLSLSFREEFCFHLQKYCILFPPTHVVTIKLYHWRSEASEEQCLGILGERQWGLRFCPVPLDSTALLRLPSVISHGLQNSTHSVTVFLYLRSVLSYFLEVSAWSVYEIMSGPWHEFWVQLGKDLQAKQEGSTGQSFLLIHHVSGVPITGQIPSLCPCWAGCRAGQWSRRNGLILAHVGLDASFRNRFSLFKS